MKEPDEFYKRQEWVNKLDQKSFNAIDNSHGILEEHFIYPEWCKRIKNKWISVDDRLPDTLLAVNVKCKDGRYASCRLGNDDIWVHNMNCGITHWKEIENV